MEGDIRDQDRLLAGLQTGTLLHLAPKYNQGIMINVEHRFLFVWNEEWIIQLDDILSVGTSCLLV